MENQELVRYSFVVAGKTYPVKVRPSEVGDLKKIEEMINSRIYEFMVKYSSLSKIEILTMGFLAVIADLRDSASQIDQEALNQRLDKLEKLLDTAR